MSGYEVITDGGRRCYWSAAEKLRIAEEALDGSASISVVARRNGVAPNLLYRWRPMLKGGSTAVIGDDDVTSSRQLRQEGSAPVKHKRVYRIVKPSCWLASTRSALITGTTEKS